MASIYLSCSEDEVEPSGLWDWMGGGTCKILGNLFEYFRLLKTVLWYFVFPLKRVNFVIRTVKEVFCLSFEVNICFTRYTAETNP